MSGPSPPQKQVLFALDDEEVDTIGNGSNDFEDGEEEIPTSGAKYAIGLKSNTLSKEHQFDADSDDLEDGDLAPNETDALNPSNSRGRRPSASRPSIPLIDRIPDRIRMSVDGLGDGLIAARRAVPGWDGEGLPDWLKRGAGTFNGTVNMANSILGAGVVGTFRPTRASTVAELG
jgi:solute carrier family 38 (sodium-coupled neutral amino acid transporter), member 11